MKKFFSFVAAVLFAGSMMADVETVYNWADNVGSSTMGTSVEATTVKIHTNTDAVNCIKFSNSYVYADGKYLSIKPAEGGFKAGDVLSVAIVFNNADDTKYAQVDLRAANGDTRIWLSDSASTINGRTSAAEPIVQTYTLEADQDSLLLGRYGNTAMCVTLLSVTREAATVTPAGTTCAEVYNMAKNDVVDLLNDVVVTYSNGANVWVKDETASMLIYLPSGFTNNFQAGDVLSGVAGVVDIYQTLVYEVKPSVDQAAAITITEGEAPAAEEVVAVTAEDINEYVILKGAAIEGAFTSDSKTSLSAVLGENTVTIYNNFKFAYTFEAGKTYDIIGVVSAYKGNPQVYFISAEEAGGEVPPTPSINYYVAGSMGVWGPDEAYRLTPSNNGEYEGEFTFAANDEFKVIGYDGTTVTWFPEGMGNNYVITEAGDYKITFNPAGNVEGWYAGFFNVVKKEAPIVHQYEVAEAIAAGLQENDEVLVRGIITKMEFKGKNFAKYGSVNIYVEDVNGAEGEFEFYNCYSLNADTFRTSIPNYDPESTAWAQFREVADANGNAIHVGDTVIAFGKYKLYNATHELNTGCYLVDIKSAPIAPADTIKLDFNTENTTYAFVDNQYFSEYGTTDIYLSDINVNASTHMFEGDGNYLVLDFYPEDANNVTGIYRAQDETLDLEYTYMLTINGTDTAVVEFADGAIQVEIGEVNKELGMAQLALAGQLISTEGDIYAITALVIAYYDFLPEEGVEDVVIDPKAIKRIVNGQVVIEKAGKTYNVNGAVVR